MGSNEMASDEKKTTDGFTSGSIFSNSTIDLGYDHTCAISDSGDLFCWGENSFGQLGNSASEILDRAYLVTELELDPVSVSAGQWHTCAILEGGEIGCWGDNRFGQLGITSNQTESLTRPISLPSPALAISAGHSHSCAILSINEVYCWGANSFGQIGINSTGISVEPAKVPLPLGKTPIGISSGSSHTCSVMGDGSAYCWGANHQGQLGNGKLTSSNVPVQVSSGQKLVAISSGYSHSCSLSINGTISCWGSNHYGQIGDGTRLSKRVPTKIDYLNSEEAIGISTGFSHTCAVTSDNLYCWGANQHGQSGVSSISKFLTLPRIVSSDDFGYFTSVSTEKRHTCATTISSDVVCWGESLGGKLGLPGSSSVSDQGIVKMHRTSSLEVTELELAKKIACANGGVDGIWCWGSDGELSLSSQNYSPDFPWKPLEGEIVQISAGYNHICAILEDASTKCWGRSSLGQLGTGPSESSFGLEEIDLPEVPETISSGYAHTCVVSNSGSIWCWGSNIFGQLGGGFSSSSETPLEVSGGLSASKLSLGHSHSCAIVGEGVACWGANHFGQLGDGSFTTRNSATMINFPQGVSISSISSGYSHTCAVSTLGDLFCWGANHHGQLGINDVSTSSNPSLIERHSLGNVLSVSAGFTHTCAVIDTGEVYCWGSNSHGQLGRNTSQSEVPVSLETNGTVSAVASGHRSTCLVFSDGLAACKGGLLDDSQALKISSENFQIELSDRDTDNDGSVGILDLFPENSSEWKDSDSDGLGNNADPDDDNDGTLDFEDDFPENSCATLDSDMDGMPDYLLQGNCEGSSLVIDDDDDNDGVKDSLDKLPLDGNEWEDYDNDGIGDNADIDDDNDGLTDEYEIDIGTNITDVDSDDDGFSDSLDRFPLDPKEWEDSDRDGMGDNSDILPQISRYSEFSDVILDAFIVGFMGIVSSLFLFSKSDIEEEDQQ